MDKIENPSNLEYLSYQCVIYTRVSLLSYYVALVTPENFLEIMLNWATTKNYVLFCSTINDSYNEHSFLKYPTNEPCEFSRQE
jgi:hypothetical protein